MKKKSTETHAIGLWHDWDMPAYTLDYTHGQKGTCVTYLIECEMFLWEGSETWERGIIWGMKMQVWIAHCPAVYFTRQVNCRGRRMFYHCGWVAGNWCNLCADAVSIRKRAFWMIICDCSTHCIMLGYWFGSHKSPNIFTNSVMISWSQFRPGNIFDRHRLVVSFLVVKKTTRHRFVARLAHTRIYSGLHPRAKGNLR